MLLMAAGVAPGVRVTLVRGPGGEVDRGLWVGREHDEAVPVGERGDRALRERERQRAGEPAGVYRLHDAIVTPADYSLAAVVSTGEPERLYSGLSLLVSTAADGERCAALLAFAALELVLDPGLERRASVPETTPSLSWGGRDTFARSLAELRDAALGLDSLDVWACAASVETMALDREALEARLRGVLSTPRFLRTVGGARLVLV
jgi:peroxiredoxin family protein